MQPLHIHVVTLDESSAVGLELQRLLSECSWCSTDVRLVTPTESSRIELQAGSAALFVAHNPHTLTGVISHLKERFPDVLFSFVNLFEHSRSCLHVLGTGFDDFLSYPFQAEDVAARIQAMHSAKRKVPLHTSPNLADALTLEVGLRDLVGVSPQFNRVLEEIRILSRLDATVLISGETGTGKDMSARAIHYTSARASGPFIPVNCGAIPDELFENELFGHERGAYTDARVRQIGLIEQANGGTLFLDEIESLSATSQVRLLRFLQDNEYTPLGSGKPQRANVRIIAATNEDLHQRVREKKFREDIYFRLEVLTLSLPPLRERRDDIPPLANHLVRRFCSTYRKPEASLSDRALHKLQSYDWPGNIRELENALHKAVVHSTSPDIAESDIVLQNRVASAKTPDDVDLLPFDQAKDRLVSRFEREYVSSLLKLCSGNVTKAAKRAGKHRRTFWEMMRRYNLSRSDF